MSFRCIVCDRSFNGSRSLRQHKRDTHTPHAFDCASCNRHYGSKDALEQHLRDSPAHAASFRCNKCDQSFDNEKALQQHRGKFPTHAPSLAACGVCNRSFDTDKALEQHLQDSPIHQQVPDTETPLDAFFRSFPTFNYDPSLPPATSYANLRQHKEWERGDAEAKDAWNRYQDALENELRLWFGGEEDLTAWHALCRAVGIEPLPNTCNQCEEAVRKTHVNIIDLIEWGRSESKKKVQTFPNLTELRDYTIRTDKIYRNPLFNKKDHNVVLRHLLRKIFGEDS
ncbi:hypothetical protein BGZ63DRAFT_359760 [Mariannaea sp. PMI_226]|nr:hypothetical protein BGZ63DRAFT_359760 [Mariannaea sp. PMI_226]